MPLLTDTPLLSWYKCAQHTASSQRNSTYIPLLFLLGNWAQVVVAVGVVAPPIGEDDSLATGAKDGKRQDEQDQQNRAVPSARNHVHVVLEDPGLVVAQVVLAEETGTQLAEDDACLRLVVGDEAGVLDELGQVDGGEVEAADGGLDAGDGPVEGNGTGTNGQANGDQLVDGASLVKVAGEGPGGGVGVVRLDGGTGPGGAAIARDQKLAVAGDNSNHDTVRDEATKDGTIDLGQEHGLWRDLEVLAELEVVAEVDRVGDHDVGPGSKVHVADRATGHCQTSNHLRQVVGGDTVTVASIEEGRKRRKEGTDDQGHEIGPDWEGDVLFGDDDDTEHETDHEHANVPPGRHFAIVLLHVGMVRVTRRLALRVLERLDCVTTPEEDAVSSKRTNRGVGNEQSIGETSGKTGRAVLGKSRLVQNTLDENLRHGVGGTVLRPERRRHEGEALGVPAVAVVDGEHDDVADEETGSHVCLENQGKGRGVRLDLLFVSKCTTEKKTTRERKG